MRGMKADRADFRHGTIVSRVRGFPSPVRRAWVRSKFPLEYDRTTRGERAVFRWSTICCCRRSQKNLVLGWGLLDAAYSGHLVDGASVIQEWSTVGGEVSTTVACSEVSIVRE